MRSQKVSNRSPRPFKIQNDQWSGIRTPKVLFTAPKPAVPAAKADAAATETPAKTPAKKAAGAGK